VLSAGLENFVSIASTIRLAPLSLIGVVLKAEGPGDISHDVISPLCAIRLESGRVPCSTGDRDYSNLFNVVKRRTRSA
jgi:hypothetical protein